MAGATCLLNRVNANEPDRSLETELLSFDGSANRGYGSHVLFPQGAE